MLRGISDALKADGVYLMQGIAGSSHVHKNMDHPIGTFLYTISTMHCMTVSLAQGGEGQGTIPQSAPGSKSARRLWRLSASQQRAELLAF